MVTFLCTRCPFSHWHSSQSSENQKMLIRPYSATERKKKKFPISPTKKPHRHQSLQSQSTSIQVSQNHLLWKMYSILHKTWSLKIQLFNLLSKKKLFERQKPWPRISLKLFQISICKLSLYPRKLSRFYLGQGNSTCVISLLSLTYVAAAY